MSDSVRPQRRQSTRLPCPLDPPGKNTGVGCHFLLQCMTVKSESGAGWGGGEGPRGRPREARNPSLLSGVLGTGLPGLGTEHLPGALCSGTGSPALGLCSPWPNRTGDGPKPHPHDSTLRESSREAQSGRRLLGTNGTWSWCTW